jgi:uncharacterized protein GlcG (DUF336 family)
MRCTLQIKSLFKLGSIILLLISFATPAISQELIETKVLPLSLAQKAADAARKRCSADGYKVSVAIVDTGGNLKVLLKSDGAGPHTPDSSFKKAYTALTLRRPTKHFAELVVKVPSLQDLGKMNENILLLAGGFPIKFKGDVVGGIGVGGAPGGNLDEACALQGLKSIQADLPGKK